MKLLTYSLTKDKVSADEWRLVFEVKQQAAVHEHGKPVLRFFSSNNMSVVSNAHVHLRPFFGNIFLLGYEGNVGTCSKCSVEFDIEADCDAFVRRLHIALHEWAEWGGFTNEHSGKSESPYTGTLPELYGTVTLYSGKQKSELERQLEEF